MYLVHHTSYESHVHFQDGISFCSVYLFFLFTGLTKSLRLVFIIAITLLVISYYHSRSLISAWIIGLCCKKCARIYVGWDKKDGSRLGRGSTTVSAARYTCIFFFGVIHICCYDLRCMINDVSWYIILFISQSLFHDDNLHGHSIQEVMLLFSYY
jgi:hypothetical protein